MRLLVRTVAWGESLSTPTISSGVFASLAAPLTISLWVYQNTNPGGASVVQNWMRLNSEKCVLRWQTDLGGNPQYDFYVHNSGGSYTHLTHPWNDQTVWRHVCGTYDLTTMKLYVSGSLVASLGNTATSFVSASDSVFFGSGAEPFDGAVHDGAIWSAALDSDEVSALSKGARPWHVRSSSLVFCVPFLANETRERGDIPEPELSGQVVTLALPSSLPRNEGGPGTPLVPWAPGSLMGTPPT